MVNNLTVKDDKTSSDDRKKEYAIEYQRQYYLENREKKLQRFKERRIENPELFRQRGKDYYKKNKEKLNEKHKENYRNNKDAVYKRHMEWLKNNREKSKAHRFVHKNNQREDYCVMCNFYLYLNQEYSVYVNNFLGNEENLDFHHTDYVLNEGVTLCRMHHIEADNRLRCKV